MVFAILLNFEGSKEMLETYLHASAMLHYLVNIELILTRLRTQLRVVHP